MPNSVSAESFVTAIPSNLLPDNVIIISETMIACTEPRSAKPIIIPMGSFSNEKSKSTINAMTAEIIAGTTNLVKRYPALPRGVIVTLLLLVEQCHSLKDFVSYSVLYPP